MKISSIFIAALIIVVGAQSYVINGINKDILTMNKTSAQHLGMIISNTQLNVKNTRLNMENYSLITTNTLLLNEINVVLYNHKDAIRYLIMSDD